MSIKSPLVSVVIPSYNHSKYLVRRMESLLNQTYKNIEILAIDDCSTENNLVILKKYESDPLVRILAREKNGGWVVVNTQGIENTKGKYILFAQCDDDCEPAMVEKLVTSLEKNPSAGLAFCRSLFVDENDRVIGDDFQNREKLFQMRCNGDTLITGKEMSRFLLHSCVIPNLSGVLFRRDCFEKVGNFSSEYIANGDWDFFFRLSSHYDFYYIAKPMNKFRQHKTTIRSHTKGRVTYEEYCRLLLGQIKIQNLSFWEKCRFRTHVMHLWAIHLVPPSAASILNFWNNSKIVSRIDPIAILFLPSAILQRIFGLIVKLSGKLLQIMRARSHS